MKSNTSVTMRWPVLVLAATLLLLAGAGVTYLMLRPGADTGATDRDAGMAGASARADRASPPAAAGTSETAPRDVVVTLGADAVERAGITVEAVRTGTASEALRLPGIVEPNAYRQVVVTPLVGGRVIRVLAELGQRVRRGQTMVHVFSPELAEAHTRYTSARAGLAAHERELERTEKLVEIGAASQQELERIHAEHTARTADVQSVRSRLELLGVPAAALDGDSTGEVGARVDVPAPIDGVVTERMANVGLNVDPASPLFTVVDLGTVWIVADLYEKDFARVRVGSPATITTTAYPGLAQQGRVNYIDPQVNSQTRTARLRVEVENARNDWRLGMYAEVRVALGDTSPVPVIARAAVQTLGDRQVVYLADPDAPGKFTEREVRLGRGSGERVEVLAGVQPGDLVVTEGSFFVRAERERLGLGAGSGAAGAGGQEGRDSGGEVQTATVAVGEQGFAPATVRLRPGVPARITFVRTTHQTCGTDVVFPALDIRRTLPLNEPVVIELTPSKPGDLAFACGMNMLRGTVVVE